MEISAAMANTIAQLLDESSEVFSNFPCTDYEIERTRENVNFIIDLAYRTRQNSDDIVDISDDGEKIITDNWLLMKMIADYLRNGCK